MNSFLKNKKIFTFKNIYAFTLVEIMVVVLIIVIIASLAMVSYTSIRVKSRDVRRISNINTLQTALNAYYKDHGVFPTSITPGQPLRNSSNNIVYLDEVPSNPQPRTDHNCPDSEFIYKVATDQQSYSLSGCVGADGDPNKGKLIYSTKEGIFHCGDKITDRDGFEYKTVSIGNQCWMAENLRTRTLPNGSCINTQKRCTGYPKICSTNADCSAGDTCINYNLTMTNSDCTWISGGITYASSSRADGLDCVSISGTQGTRADCDAGRTVYSPYDALQCKNSSTAVAELTCGTDEPLLTKSCCGNTWINNENIQGLCPNGWHIPTDGEFSVLEIFLSDSPTCNPIRDNVYQCQGAGAKLKVGGSSGFNAQLIGQRQGRDGSSCLPPPDKPHQPPFTYPPSRCYIPSYPPFPTNTLFIDNGSRVSFITSRIGNGAGDTVLIRELNSTDSVGRFSKNVSSGRAFPVRCIKD